MTAPRDPSPAARAQRAATEVPGLPGRPSAVPAAQARVSTSPEHHASSPAAAAHTARPMLALDEGPPLTRAAARRRVETMSPARWLEHFGPVQIERRE